MKRARGGEITAQPVDYGNHELRIHELDEVVPDCPLFTFCRAGGDDQLPGCGGTGNQPRENRAGAGPVLCEYRRPVFKPGQSQKPIAE